MVVDVVVAGHISLSEIYKNLAAFKCFKVAEESSPCFALFLPLFLLETPGRELSYFLQIGITEEVFVPCTEDEIHEFFEADETVLQHDFERWKQLYS